MKRNLEHICRNEKEADMAISLLETMKEVFKQEKLEKEIEDTFNTLVHNEFKALELEQLKAEHPEAVILVHPESPAEVVAQGDVVGSTSKLLQAAIHRPEKTFIVATDLGILHEMKKHAPQKTFIAAPTAGNSATCKSCAFCPWMAMNGVQGVYQALKYGTGEIHLTESLMADARHALTPTD